MVWMYMILHKGFPLLFSIHPRQMGWLKHDYICHLSLLGRDIKVLKYSQYWT